ncbi:MULTISPECIES: LysR family transcriptional regulator [unclassified Marinovum]
MLVRNLDVTVLRSFVAVAQTGGVTRAAGFLNLTQSAVSMQLKRLEELLGLELLDRSARRIALTGSGEQLLGYAKRMVELNDEAFARLTHEEYSGQLTLGVPYDIVYPVVPRVMQRFAAEMPRVRVQLVTGHTAALKADFARGALDLILTTESEVDTGGETLTEIALRWIGAPDGQAWRQRPLCLAQARVCAFRSGIVEKLDAAGLDWISVVDTDSDRTVEATVSADLAVCALLEGTAPKELIELPASCDLPDLGSYRINVYRNRQSGQKPVDVLADMIEQGYDTL